jgi:adenylate cyclase
MAPGETARLLRELHRRIETAVLAEGGVLSAFLGDGAMVVFGLPEPKPDDAVRALACAHRLVAELPAEGGASVRVGIHCGPIAVAWLGGEQQRQFSVAGDTVNVASRLEALAKGKGPIAISAAVAEAARAAGRADLLAGFAELPPQAIRGRETLLSVWVAAPASA